jgi:bloom syndrome protein
MALTATANEECKQDIVARLNIPRCEMLTSSFNRSNLYYEVHNSNMSKKLVDEVAQRIKSRYHKQTGVIYSLSKRSCEEIAAQLREDHHIQAYHYHAEMSKEDKRMVQQEWNQSKIHVIVATVCILLYPVHPSLTTPLDRFRYGYRQG